MAPIEFSPCKRCSSFRHRIIPYRNTNGFERITYRITCPNCGYATKEKDTLEEAVYAWNYPSAKSTFKKIL